MLRERREDGGQRLREVLMDIGAAVAESSGAQLTMRFAAQHGQFAWTRSAGTSPAERTALDDAAEALSLTPSGYARST
jgi:hypothetical protein